MRRIFVAMAALGLAAFSSQQGMADCVDMTTSGNQQAHAKMAKDGTHAPMESGAKTQAQPGPATGSTTTSSDTAAKAPQKGGDAMPMGESPDVATSGQDVEAQQKGGKTAAAAASGNKC